jgi:hypothetical protein
VPTGWPALGGLGGGRGGLPLGLRGRLLERCDRCVGRSGRLTYGGGSRASAGDTDRRLQLTVRHGGVELARSPMLFSLRDQQGVRVVASEDPGLGLTERERISAAIAGPLGTASLGALTLEEVELVAQQADVYPPYLALLVRATAIGANAPVTTDELYAVGREGLPLTVAGLLAHEAAERTPLMRALYDHMSDRNLADAVSLVTGIASEVLLNEVSQAAHLESDDASVRTIIRRLEPYGFAQWTKED